jgi:2,4-dienoyl-CoA reductase-like NADH-dependent reductase (Old Yellow Enzyme family)
VPLNTEKLFEPFVLNGLQLPNRIVMAPMTRNFSPGGVPGENVAAYYRRRAEGGVGLIITEGTIIGHPAAGHKLETPNIYGDAAIAGCRASFRRCERPEVASWCSCGTSERITIPHFSPEWQRRL